MLCWFLFKATSWANASPSGAWRVIWATLAETCMFWVCVKRGELWAILIDCAWRLAEERAQDSGEERIWIMIALRSSTLRVEMSESVEWY